MSENTMGFQSQLAALMEMLVKAVVCETTKLFESGVLQLRVEMANMRQENEELKARLQQRSGVADRHSLSLAQRCQSEEKISNPHTDKSSNPTVQLTRSKADDVVKMSPIVTLKEEDSAVDLVLVKHEDLDTEELRAEVSKEMFSIQDTSKETAVKKNEMHSSTCDDREDLPCDVQAAHVEGMKEVVRQDEACEDLIDRSNSAKGTETLYSTGRGSVSKKTLENKQEIQNRNHLKTDRFAKECCEQVNNCSTDGASWRWAVCNEEDSQTVVGGLSLPWATAQHAETQYTSYTEEDAECTSVRTLSRSCCIKNVFLDIGQGTQKTEPLVEVMDKMDSTEPRLRGTCFDGQKGHECRQYLDRNNCSGEIADVPPWDGPQVPPDGLPWQCRQCGRILSSNAALEAHQSVHTGERPYSCYRCGKTFPSLRGLNRHSHVHTGERQYQCSQCGKSFVYQFSLTKHQLIHSGEKAHTCKHCDKSFIFKSDLTIHMRKHTGETPYSCGICGKKFKHRRTLNMHLQGHAGEKRHICTHCGKSFLDLGNFKRHKRIHTGEKPYSCQLCGKSFTQSAHLKKHSLTHR